MKLAPYLSSPSLYKFVEAVMKHFPTFILFLIVLFIVAPGFAQGVFISSTPYTSDIEMFMLSDFNFTGKGSSNTEIFELNISNLSSSPTRCYLKMVVQAETLGPMATGETDPFELAAGENIRITNRNMFSAAHQFTLQDYQITNTGNQMTTELLSTGRLPADVYFFMFTLVNVESGLEYGQTIIRFNLTNPRMLHVISPGVLANSSEEARIFTPFPLFRWESDMSAFRLVIAEMLDDARDDTSPEEVLQQRVIFDRTLQINKGGLGSLSGAEIIPSTLYQYPVAGARSLEEGKIYYWQVTGLVATSGAPQEFPGEIWKFQLAGTGASRMLTPLQQQILNLVRELDPELLKPGGNLAGFIPTESVKKNGAEISDKKIIDTLAKIVNNDFEALDVSVE
jgi:hypothetical protein